MKRVADKIILEKKKNIKSSTDEWFDIVHGMPSGDSPCSNNKVAQALV